MESMGGPCRLCGRDRHACRYRMYEVMDLIPLGEVTYGTTEIVICQRCADRLGLLEAADCPACVEYQEASR